MRIMEGIKRMNLFEYENKVFGEVWNEKTIKELQEQEPVGGTGWEQKEYELWYGRRFPQWL